MIGAPSAGLFAYTLDLGIAGIWMGACFTSSFLLIGYKILTRNIDWEKLHSDLKTKREKEKLESDF